MTIRTLRIVLTMVVLALACSPGNGRDPIEPPPLEPEVEAVLAGWLQERGVSPTEYVVGLFADHDVVILGERHRQAHDVELVASLLAPLHAAGVRAMATEFLRREDQPWIDSLVTGPEWNEELARLITFRQFIAWGFREYLDIYRAAWQLNRSLPPGTPRFRVLGMNNSPDWSHVQTEDDRDRGEVMRRVWHGETEADWARVVLEEVANGEKVLAHCGMHHAFSRFRQPIVGGGSFICFVEGEDARFGNVLHDSLGDRVFTVSLHYPWPDSTGYGGAITHPADGAIDRLMLDLGPRPVGFDIVGGPFGDLRARNAVYRHGYPEFRLADFCDGWIYTMPISEYRSVQPIEGWIHEGNLEEARAQSPNPAFRGARIERFRTMLVSDARLGTAPKLR